MIRPAFPAGRFSKSGPMFRLIRLSVLLLLAFAAGMFVERGHQMDRCSAEGGKWLPAGICGGK